MTIHETFYRPELLRYLEPKDVASVAVASKIHYEEAHVEELNTFFDEVNQATINHKRFSSLQITDTPLSVLERLSLKLQPFIERIFSKKSEPLLNRLVEYPIIQTLFLTMLEKRVPLSKLDYAFFLLKKRAILEKKNIPRCITDAFLEKSLFGASLKGKVINESSVYDVKKELELLFDRKEDIEEEFLHKLDTLLGSLRKYTSIYRDLASKEKDPFLHKLRSLVLEVIKECREKNRSMDSWGHIRILYYAIMAMEGQWNSLYAQETRQIRSDEKYQLIRLADDHKHHPGVDVLQDREKIEALLQHNGLILWQLSEQHRNDKELVLTAIRQNPVAIQFAEKKALQHKEILWTALKKKKILILTPLVLFFLKKKEQNFCERLKNGEIQDDIKFVCFLTEVPRALYDQLRQIIVPCIKQLFK